MKPLPKKKATDKANQSKRRRVSAGCRFISADVTEEPAVESRPTVKPTELEKPALSLSDLHCEDYIVVRFRQAKRDLSYVARILSIT